MTDLTPLETAPAWLRLSRRVARGLPAGRFRFMNWVCRRRAPLFWWRTARELGGLSFLCDLRDSIAREVFLTGRYEPQETVLLKRMLGPGNVFVDVGANWGYFSLLAAAQTGPSGQVVSLEPDPRLAALFRANVGRNGLRQVVLHEAAAGERAGWGSLDGFDEGGGNWGLSRIAEQNGTSGGNFRVRCVALDSLLDEMALDRIDVLKMDIEGAEHAALQGMREGLRRHRYRRILLEVHPAYLAERGRSAADLFGLLAEAGYRGWEIDHSPRASRRSYYANKLAPEVQLGPVVVTDRIGSWPHYLWVSPDVDGSVP